MCCRRRNAHVAATQRAGRMPKRLPRAPPRSIAAHRAARQRSKLSRESPRVTPSRSTTRAARPVRCASRASMKARASAARCASRRVPSMRSSARRNACTVCWLHCAAAATFASRLARSTASRWCPPAVNGHRRMRSPRARGTRPARCGFPSQRGRCREALKRTSARQPSALRSGVRARDAPPTLAVCADDARSIRSPRRGHAAASRASPCRRLRHGPTRR